MILNKNFYIFIFILFVVPLNPNICIAEQDTLCVTIKTPSGGMAVEQICKKINEQIGNSFTYVYKEYRETTVDIELKNIDYITALMSLEKKVRLKHGDSTVAKEGKVYVIRKREPLVDPDESFYCHELKYVSFDYLKGILQEKIPDSNKKLRIVYYKTTNSIWVNCKDEKIKPLIRQIFDKYDVNSGVENH